ncbi:MAG: hypothetical protein MJK14_15930 [Rivularia sp. ALOHA_DT_140]|nr:hypothetical protein [Rivularia sp. ALOHA_DT_140]
MRGNIQGVCKILDKVEETGEQFRAFTSHIRQLADNFQIKKIREFVKSFDEVGL